MARKNEEQLTFEFEPIKGYPMLNWKGKHPYKSTVYYPAQLKEIFGKSKPYTDKNGNTADWFNKIYWGDNLQIMSHLLREFRGKIDLIYIDPPYDSKADYKKTIKLKGEEISNDRTAFEEKQYSDIWANDDYLQFMYERLILMRELLSDKGSIYLHCDWHKSHHLRMMMDEIFGADNFKNEIIWHYADYMQGNATTALPKKHDNILFYTKNQNAFYDRVKIPLEIPIKRNRVIWDKKTQTLKVARDQQGKIIYDEFTDKYLDSVWDETVLNIGQTSVTRKTSSENLRYPTQKPSKILELIIEASSEPGNLILDCFMGSGTTQAVSMKLGRRFIGADINLGAIQTTTNRLINIAKETELVDVRYTGFEVYNVNNYDVFRNPVEAKRVLLDALEVIPLDNSVYDGEKDGRKYKIMPADVNRIATKGDIEGFINNLPYKEFNKKKTESLTKPVLELTIGNL